MAHPLVSKEEAIDKLRAQIQPEQYLASLAKMRDTYLERASELLGNRDLNAASNRTDPRDVEMVNIQFTEALADLSWRVDTLNDRIADFEATKKDITRPFERQVEEPKKNKAEEMPEETEVEESALAASLTDEQRAAVEHAVAESQEAADAAAGLGAGPPPESVDEIAARRAQVEGEASQQESED